MASYEQIAAITAGGISYRLAVDIGVYEDGGWRWCEITKLYATKHPPLRQDPGVARLAEYPDIERVSERNVWVFGSQPITLKLRNEDGFFCRTKSVQLIDSSNNIRTLQSFHRARVRLRWVPETDDTGTERTIGYFFIDGQPEIKRPYAYVTLQPWKKLFMSVSLKSLKDGDRWFRDVPVGYAMKRISCYCIDDIHFEEGSPPATVLIDGKPYTSEEDDEYIGPYMNRRGRQPQYDAFNKDYITDQNDIPTCNKEDDSNTDRVWYSTMDANGIAKLYHVCPSTNQSTLIWTGTDAHHPIKFIKPDGNYVWVATIGNSYPNNMRGFYNRQLKIWRIAKSGISSVNYVDDYCWTCNDTVQKSEEGYNGFYWIGYHDDALGGPRGEQLTIPFSQAIMGIYENPGSGMTYYDRLSGIWPNLRQKGGHDDYDEPVSTQSSPVFIKDHAGWSLCGTGLNQPGAAWNHLNSHPEPCHWLDLHKWIVWLRWNDVLQKWQHVRYLTSSPTIPPSGFDLNFSGVSGEVFYQRQPTGTCVYDAADQQLGTVNYMYIATIGFQWLPEYAHQTRLFRINLSSGAQTPVQLHSVAPVNTDQEFPTFLSMCVVPSATGIPNVGDPWLVGVKLNRKNRTYRMFMFNLRTSTMMDDSTGEYFGPSSSAPLVGLRPYMKSTAVPGFQAVYFVNCADGTLWRMDCNGGRARIEGQGQRIAESDTWLACSQLVILPASTQDGTDAKILGFSAPGPPVTNFPVRESDGYPKYNTEGNYNLWNLDDKIEVRVPICDYSEENVETAYDALKLHLQSCGPNWVFDFNDDGEFYIKKRDTESEPELTLVASDEDSSDWSDRKIHLLNLHRKPLAGDDVQNQISIVPYIADIPTVGVKLSLVARREDINPCVQVSAHALSDSARRVVLTCVRDGIAGILEGEISGVPVGREGDWASSVLFSVAEDTQEFLTELAADFDTASNICSLVGLRYHPDGYNRHRLLGDAEIWSTRDLGNTMPPAGDYIFIGDEARATIKRFTTVNEMQLTPSAEWVAPIIPRGTTVKIVPMRGYKAVQEYQTGLEGHGQIIDTIPATGNPVTIYVTPTEFPYTGYVAEIGYEAFLITRVSRLDSADGYYPGQKELLATRAYFDTEMAIHYGGAPIRFYLHPIHGRPVYIGNTGLVAQFNVENTDNIEERRWLVGDVVELDFTGARAVKAEFFTATSDSPSSILRSGKKKLTLDENYYISTLVAPHLAYALTQYLKDPKLPFDAEIPYAPWISGVNRIRVRSEYDLPDEPNNEIICVLRGYAHYSSQRKTILNLISETAAAGDPEAATGMGVPEGGIV